MTQKSLGSSQTFGLPRAAQVALSSGAQSAVCDPYGRSAADLRSSRSDASQSLEDVLRMRPLPWMRSTWNQTRIERLARLLDASETETDPVSAELRRIAKEEVGGVEHALREASAAALESLCPWSHWPEEYGRLPAHRAVQVLAGCVPPASTIFALQRFYTQLGLTSYACLVFRELQSADLVPCPEMEADLRPCWYATRVGSALILQANTWRHVPNDLLAASAFAVVAGEKYGAQVFRNGAELTAEDRSAVLDGGPGVVDASRFPEMPTSWSTYSRIPQPLLELFRESQDLPQMAGAAVPYVWHDPDGRFCIHRMEAQQPSPRLPRWFADAMVDPDPDGGFYTPYRAGR